MKHMILIPKPCMRAVESQKCIEYILVPIFLETGDKFIPLLNSLPGCADLLMEVVEVQLYVDTGNSYIRNQIKFRNKKYVIIKFIKFFKVNAFKTIIKIHI